MEHLNNQFKSGILPQQLNYNIENACVDFSKLQYNRRYQSFDFFASSCILFLFKLTRKMAFHVFQLNNYSRVWHNSLSAHKFNELN